MVNIPYMDGVGTSLTLRRRCFLPDSGSTGAGYADFVRAIEDPSGFVFQLGENRNLMESIDKNL